MTQALRDRIWRPFAGLVPRAPRFLIAVAAGTTVGFLISLSRALIKSGEALLKPYLLPLPADSLMQALVVLLLLLAIGLLKQLPRRTWRSLRLGLIPLQYWVWVPSIAVFWVAHESHHGLVAWSSVALAGLVTVLIDLIGRESVKVAPDRTGALESDLPVPEGGEDLLGRRETIEGVVSKILLEQPAIIAVTGAYGEGKTSFLNLAIGELHKLVDADLPVIVRFNPWLAADSNALVLSLLNSIVARIQSEFVVPGLGADAARYARTLLSVIPKADGLKDFLAEPSQEERIDALVNRIARTCRRVLVVLDDLDRMAPGELETVFKLLRGSDKLSNITFLCSFDPKELGLILKVTRPFQDINTFIEKFFPVQFPLPKVDSSDLQDLLSRKIAAVVSPYGTAPDDSLSKSLKGIWESGASLYFGNLRRMKLFLNRISYSLERIADEVNIEDFIRLELIRDIAPDLYEKIYRSPEYFWNRHFAFEAGFKGPNIFDKDEAKKERAAFYTQLKNSVPEEKQYVFQLLEGLFPQFALYQEIFGIEAVSAADAERARRISHPRCFRQYFLLKVPSELFSQKEFKAFDSSVRSKNEDETAEAFSETFRSILNEDFRRWHFMHLIENRFDDFGPQVARGLCRGMARNSALWPTDAFELMIAIRCTHETLKKDPDRTSRLQLLRTIVRESASDLYVLTLLWRMQKLEEEAGGKLLADLHEIRTTIKEQLRAHYLTGVAASVFEQFGSLGSGANRTEPNQFLFSWQLLGPDAQSDQREYLRSLFRRRPKDLDEFLKLMFRVDFIDDYTTLKPLIDYNDLSELITLNEAILDRQKVEQFRMRYNAEQSVAVPESCVESEDDAV
jgi:KAP family P-loop domain